MNHEVSVPAYGGSSERRHEAFLDGDLPVAVYGLGKMGLPLAAVYADICSNVIGADTDETVRGSVNRGDCHVEGEPGLPALVERVVEEGALRARDNREAAADAAIHVVMVPTRIDDRNAPDLSILDAVVEDIASGLSAGDLVIVECTVPPKTCRERVAPALEAGSGLAQEEFGLAFCPERTSSGRALADIRGAYPKVVGGTDDDSTEAARTIYEEVNSAGVIAVADATTAEAVKLFEGVYRDVNIGLANELARFTDELGIDVNEAIRTANTQPFCEIHSPGPGVGGHCIPYYPYFLAHDRAEDAPLLRTARDVNDSMPGFVVRKLREELEAEGRELADARVLVLGLTYRPGVNETAATPARPVISGLSDAGADVLCVDPLLEEYDEFDATPVALDEITDCAVDAAAMITPHEAFDAIDWNEFDSSLVIIDGRRTLDLSDTPHRVYTIGSGLNV